MITVVPVETKKQQREFVKFPLKLYPWFPKTYIYADNSFQNQDLKMYLKKLFILL